MTSARQQATVLQHWCGRCSAWVREEPGNVLVKVEAAIMLVFARLELREPLISPNGSGNAKGNTIDEIQDSEEMVSKKLVTIEVVSLLYRK